MNVLKHTSHTTKLEVDSKIQFIRKTFFRFISIFIIYKILLLLQKESIEFYIIEGHTLYIKEVSSIRYDYIFILVST